MDSTPKEKVIVEGYVKNISPWRDKGFVTDMVTDGGIFQVAFSHELRVPRKEVNVRLQATRGTKWLFAEKWEYIVAPKGSTKAGWFPQTQDIELENAAWEIIRSLNEFTVDDLHPLESLIEEKGRDRRVLGSILTKLKARGLIKEIRIVHSQRETCHKRPVVLWTRTVSSLG